MPRLARTLGTLVLLAGAAACVPAEAGDAIPAGRSDHTIVVGGRTRTFHLYRPDSLPAAVPLVVMLHGGFGSGAQAERDYGWDTMAGTGRFVVAYPDGFGRAWNAGAGCCGRPGTQDVDDVAFVAAVVTRIRRGLPVDPSRVYAAGMSNGAMLAYRLACDTDLFAAIAPVAGTLLGPCPRPRPVSLLHIHGTADQRVPYDGSRGIGQSAIDGPPVPDLITRWRTAGGCGAATVRTEGPSTISTATCANGRAIELITVAGAGHQWPGGAGDRVLLDKPSDAFDATATIWSFFAGHCPASRRPTPPDEEELRRHFDDHYLSLVPPDTLTGMAGPGFSASLIVRPGLIGSGGGQTWVVFTNRQVLVEPVNERLALPIP